MYTGSGMIVKTWVACKNSCKYIKLRSIFDIIILVGQVFRNSEILVGLMPFLYVHTEIFDFSKSFVAFLTFVTFVQIMRF